MNWLMTKIRKGNADEATSILQKVDAGCVLCSSGSVSIKVNGKVFRLSGGQLFIYPPYATMEFPVVSSDFECVVFDVDHQFLLSTLKSVSWSDNMHLISDNPIASLSKHRLARFRQLIPLLESDRAEMNRTEALAIECLKQAFTYEVLAVFAGRMLVAARPKAAKDSVVLEFQAMLKRECFHHKDVAYYASAQGLTPRYFTTIIREMTGKPASYWINQAVIVEAQHLMLDNSISLKEITFRLNFSSQTFFSRWYRQSTGETPSQFRKRNRI